MFRYAAGKALADQKGVDLLLDVSFLKIRSVSEGDFIARPYELDIFPNIREKVVDIEEDYLLSPLKQKIFRRLGRGNYRVPLYKERFFTYDTLFGEKQPPFIMDGDLQSEKYFFRSGALIRHAFQFPAFHSDDINESFLSKIKSCNSIAVHVRRGDYLMPYNFGINGVCEKDYYVKAISLMKGVFENAVFFFFSNDMDWVRENLLSLTDNYILIEGNTDKDSWKDMCLMSHCRYNIIANSSFSWWGAWLNYHSDKLVCAPRKWFASDSPYFNTQDLFPESWMLI